jgi:integrase
MQFATQKAVDALVLPPGKGEVILFDDDLPGLGLRLRTGGSRVWVFQYKTGARNRRMTLGAARVLSLVQARRMASELYAKVRLGRDPAGEKIESRAHAAETFAALVQAYLTRQRARLRPLSFDRVERHLLKHCRPLHPLQLDKIDRRTIAARLAAIETNNGPVAANRVQSSLSAFFMWSMRQGIVDSNPVIGTERRQERSRDRVLNADELKEIWNATAGDDDYSVIVRLLMLTGQRITEIGALRWLEIEGDRITLPAARTKNKRTHVIPLAPVARAILDTRRRNDDFVFGRVRGRPFGGWSVGKAALDARLPALAPWVHHDIRRSVATSMAEIGVEPHVIEAVLNHVSGHKAGVAGVYNRASYEQQKTTALQRWAEHLLAIVEGRQGKIVAFR